MMAHLSTSMAPPALLILRKDVLAQDPEVRLVRREREHDEVGVETINDVLGVGVVRRVGALAANKVHDLVLAFSGD